MEGRTALRPQRLIGRHGLFMRVSLLLVLAVVLLGMPQITPAAQPTAAPQDCTPLAAVPALVSPANGGTSDSNNAPPLGIPKFVWGTASQATYYEIQVSSDPSFPNDSRTYDRRTYATSHTPITDPGYYAYFPNGVPIYWHIRSYDYANCASAWASTFTFTRNWSDAPALLAPDNNVTLSFLEHPIFSWSPIPGATRYLLRVSTDSTCLASNYWQYVTAETEFNPIDRLPPANYYWCVAGLDAANREGHLSTVRAFSFSDLATPTLRSPSNGAVLSFTPALSWSAVKGAARYRVQYSNSSDFSNATVRDTVYTSYTPQFMLGNETNWYWKVAAIDTNNREGPYASYSTFRLNWVIQPQPLTPNNLYFHVTYPYFQWTGVPEAREYELQIAKTSSFPPDQIVVDVRTSATSYMISPPNFDLVQTYYWRVIAYGTNNIQGGTSSFFSFKFDSAAGGGSSTVPTQFWPPFAYNADTRIDRPITTSVSLPLFQWQRVTNATSYTFTLGSTINMTDTLFSATTTQPNFSPQLSDNGGNGFNFDPARIYYWQVRCSIGTNACPVASQIWAVRVNPALDFTFNVNSNSWLQSPPDLQDSVNMEPIFKWYPYPNANKYTLQVATDSNFSNIVQTVNTSFAGTALRQQLPRDIYYWRVLAYNGTTLLSTATANRLHIFGPIPYASAANIRSVSGSTVATGTVAANPYDISAVYATKYAGEYKLGLTTSGQTGTAVEYKVALNLDYSLQDVNGQPSSPSGAPADPDYTNIHYRGEYQPEYVVTFSRSAAGTWSNPQLHRWLQTSGGYDSTLIDIVSAGGAFSPTNGYVEMAIPTGAVLSYQGNADLNVPTGDPTLLGIEAYTTDGTGSVHDTVPDDPTGIGSSPTLSEFRSVSDHPNLAYPFNTDYGGNGQGIQDALSILFNSSLSWYIPEPTESYGFDLETAVDRGFTSGVADYSTRLANGLTAYQFMDGGFAGGVNGGRNLLPVYPANTYYWRVRTCRNPGIPCGNPGSWSKPSRFNKVNIKVDSPTVTINSGVPTFNWPRTEGAYQYQVDVHTNPQYSNFYDGINPIENISYTPLNNDYREQDYYYRLRASEYYYPPIDQAPWTQVGTLFHVTIPVPQNLHIVEGSVVDHSPTLAWDNVLEPNPNPVMGADHYQVQVSNNSGFNQLIDDVRTVNLNWSLGSANYPGGSYYVRARTLLNANNAVSAWTTPITFTKQYPLVATTGANAVRSGNCSITFTWPAFNVPGQPTERSGIFGYRLETADDINFSVNHRIFDTNNTSFTNYDDIGGCTYSPYTATYWRVSMLDAYVNQGPADIRQLVAQPTPIGGSTETPCALPFVDVGNSNFARQYITYLYCHGIVNGLDATHYGPNATSTRAQFSKMIVLARGLPLVTPGGQHFHDVRSDYYAYLYIETAATAGIVSGYDQNSCAAANSTYPCFLPNRPVTRSAVAKFVVAAWAWPRITPTGGNATFTDIPPSHPFFVDIETAHQHGIVNGYSAAQCLAAGHDAPCYLGGRSITRAELSVPLWLAIHNP